ncbi:MAG TPA: hypothetical protein PLU16_07330 [Gallionellaceae bacterium]|nr:hypothetical protein [Gallionellaceae bacterium]HQS75006.1 hypothetical protein [Gallionellaceae bacterium]
MKIFRMVVIATLLTIAGCTSVDMMRAKSPSLELSSTNKAKVVAGCIAIDLQDVLETPLEGNATLRARPISGGYSIWLKQGVAFGSTTALVIDVTDTPSGSVTNFHHDLVPMYLERVKRIINTCQSKNI